MPGNAACVPRHAAVSNVRKGTGKGCRVVRAGKQKPQPDLLGTPIRHGNAAPVFCWFSFALRFSVLWFADFKSSSQQLGSESTARGALVCKNVYGCVCVFVCVLVCWCLVFVS